MEAVFRYGNPRMVRHTPSGAIAAGEVVVVGSLALIAHNAIAADALGALAAGGGVYQVAGDAVIAAGKRVCWNTTANKATETWGSNKVLGYSVSACSGDGETFDVLHDPQTDEVTTTTTTTTTAAP